MSFNSCFLCQSVRKNESRIAFFTAITDVTINTAWFKNLIVILKNSCYQGESAMRKWSIYCANFIWCFMTNDSVFITNKQAKQAMIAALFLKQMKHLPLYISLLSSIQPPIAACGLQRRELLGAGTKKTVAVEKLSYDHLGKITLNSKQRVRFRTQLDRGSRFD